MRGRVGVGEEVRRQHASDHEGQPENAWTVERLVDDGVETKLLTTPAVLAKRPSEQLERARADAADFEVRTTADVDLTFDVLDSVEVYISLPAPFARGERAGAVVIRDEDLAESMEARFREAWRDATPADAVAADD